MPVHLTNSSMHSEEEMANNILTFCGEVGVGTEFDKTSTIKMGVVALHLNHNTQTWLKTSI